jgi:hypothetical protein
MLTSRRPFPPEANKTNLGRYGNVLDNNCDEVNNSSSNNPEEEIVYSMFNSMIALFFSGLFLGWNAVKPIPLFPSWLGGLLGAAFIIYLSTFSDSNGDFIRFLAYTVTSTCGSLLNIADEVELRDKTGVILGQTLFFLHGIDKKFQIRKRFMVLLSEIIAKITMFR